MSNNNVTPYMKFVEAAQRRNRSPEACAKKSAIYFQQQNVLMKQDYDQMGFDGVIALSLHHMNSFRDMFKVMSQENNEVVQDFEHTYKTMTVSLFNAFPQEAWDNMVAGYQDHLKLNAPEKHKTLLDIKESNEGLYAENVFPMAMLKDMDAFSEMLSGLVKNFPQMYFTPYLTYPKDMGVNPIIKCTLKDNYEGDIGSHFQTYLNVQSGIKSKSDIRPFR